MNREILIAITSLTGYMRKALLNNESYSLTELAKFMGLHNTPSQLEDLLADLLNSDYRDEQLEIFCSMITHTSVHKSDNFTITYTADFPPPKILAALAGTPLELIIDQYATAEGRHLQELYITRYWIPARDHWLAQLDKDLEKSGLLERYVTNQPKPKLIADQIEEILSGGLTIEEFLATRKPR